MPQTFSALTTLAVGGPAGHLTMATDPARLIEAARHAWAAGEDWMLLGGGSNLVVGDDGFDGETVLVATRGIEVITAPPGDIHAVRIRVQAGEPWDAVVAHAVEHGWSGIEALSGIPGSSGAAPIQNIGAYGQEVAAVLISVEFLDHETGQLQHLPAADLGFGYRSSVFKQGRAGLVVSIDLELRSGGRSAPVAYEQLAAALGVELGDRVPVADLRAAVLKLRASKGMVLSPDDPDSVSAGSFFTNPIVSENFARALPRDAPRWPLASDEPARILPLNAEIPAPSVRAEAKVKLSAAWLIEHVGIHRGFHLPGARAAVSSKHTLAIVNTGGASAEEIAELARFIRWRVGNDFGILLQPEPVLVGIHL